MAIVSRMSYMAIQIGAEGGTYRVIQRLCWAQTVADPRAETIRSARWPEKSL